MGGGDLSDSFRALAYVGTVKAVRQEYTVFRSAAGDYMVFSPSSRSPSSYHVTFVPFARVEALKGLISGKDVTTNSVLKDESIRGVFGAKEKASLRFDALMTLYAMNAAGLLDMRRAGRSLSFSSKKNS